MKDAAVLAGKERAFNGVRNLLNLKAAVKDLRLALFSIYIMPLVVIAYLYTQYIYPMFTASGQEVMALGISAVLTLAVVLSVLGLALITRLANNSTETLKSLNERMDKLLATAKEFEATGYVDSVIDSFAKSAKDLLYAEASSILLYDGEGNLRFEYVEGPASGFLKGKVLRQDEGIAAWSAREGKPIVRNNVKHDPRYMQNFDRESGFRTKSVVCAPLIFGGRTLGVIEVVNKLGGEDFTDQDMHALMSLSGHAAAAIYRNRVEEDLRGDLIQVLDIIVTATDNHLPEKQGHARRVAEYSVKLAKSLGLCEDEVRGIYFGAMLHDIGFLRLNVAESGQREKIALHPTLGSEMLKKISQWAKVAPMVRDHHEHFDGGGYPSGLVGQEISLGGRIIAVAETFDVLTHKSYKNPIKFEDAVQEIKNSSGSQFDPELVDVFLAAVRKEDISVA